MAWRGQIKAVLTAAEVARRAGGRRHYNRMRHEAAAQRRLAVYHLWRAHVPRAAMAAKLGVAPTTINYDLDAVHRALGRVTEASVDLLDVLRGLPGRPPPRQPLQRQDDLWWLRQEAAAKGISTKDLVKQLVADHVTALRQAAAQAQREEDQRREATSA